MNKFYPILWFGFGVTYGLAMRLIAEHASGVFKTEIISFSFLLGTPFVIGAIVIYGFRYTKPSVMKMIFAPWIAVLLALIGSIISLLEGSICIVLISPLFFAMSSVGGLVMGLILRWFDKKGKTTLNCFLVLPLAFMLVEPNVPEQPVLLEERVSIEVAASPDRIWEEILNARDIRKEELPLNFTHWIGVPRPVEGVNVMTPQGEVRYSKWERGVNFAAHVTEKTENRSITWRYEFNDDSFPKGSMDDHVKIGGEYFDLHDTTFNLVPISENLTKLEIISHYSVSTNVNFYGVPVAELIAHDF
ncbi:MAG: hypothetical protein VXY16_05180, partial [Pseudomonadota bacterium]|nr:hypothetical protein [Pseudomonadota bacterium]